jgi:uncharacterized protein YaaN involved in tellurite resistance
VSNTSHSSNPAEPAKASPGSVSEVPDPAPGALEIAPEARERIERLVAGYLDSILHMPATSLEYGRALDAIDHLGERDFVATAVMSGRVLDRRFEAMRGLLAARAPLARQMADLRKAATGLDPARIKLGGRRSPHEELEELDRYFERFSKSRPRIEGLLASLTEGRLALEQDNAAVVTEQASLATEIQTLRQYAFMARLLDGELTARIDDIARTDAARAKTLRVDLLSVVRRRHQEILTQLAIVTQGYAALRIVEDNNADVIRAVASAITTTAGALRTAVMVASAAASQRATLEQLQAARLAATAMANHAAALEADVSGPGGHAAMLRAAWGEVYDALDRVEAQKARVLRTISEADRELTHRGPSPATDTGPEADMPGSADPRPRLR